MTIGLQNRVTMGFWENPGKGIQTLKIRSVPSQWADDLTKGRQGSLEEMIQHQGIGAISERKQLRPGFPGLSALFSGRANGI